MRNNIENILAKLIAKSLLVVLAIAFTIAVLGGAMLMNVMENGF